MIIKKQINKLWSEKEKELGTQLHPNFRSLIMADWDPIHDDETDLEDLGGIINDGIKKVMAFYGSYQSKDNENFNIEAESIPAKRRYQKCFEERLHLIDFVLKGSNSLDMNFLTERAFSNHKRIKWKKICESWNKSHPYDLMTVPVLKVEFYRAIRERDIELEFFSRKSKEFRQLVAPVVEAINQGVQRLWEAIKKYYPQVDDIEDLISELRKSPAFKGLDVEKLSPRKVIQILESHENDKVKGGTQ